MIKVVLVVLGESPAQSDELHLLSRAGAVRDRVMKVGRRNGGHGSQLWAKDCGRHCLYSEGGLNDKRREQSGAKLCKRATESSGLRIKPTDDAREQCSFWG